MEFLLKEKKKNLEYFFKNNKDFQCRMIFFKNIHCTTHYTYTTNNKK